MNCLAGDSMGIRAPSSSCFTTTAASGILSVLSWNNRHEASNNHLHPFSPGLPCSDISSIRAALRFASIKSASVIRSFFCFLFGFIVLWFTAYRCKCYF